MMKDPYWPDPDVVEWTDERIAEVLKELDDDEDMAEVPPGALETSAPSAAIIPPAPADDEPVEACRTLLQSGTVVGSPTITIDSGRYVARHLAASLDDIRTKLVALSSASRKIQVERRLSHDVPGLQLADIVANTVWRSLQAGDAVSHDRLLVQELVKTAHLVVQEVKLGDRVPHWFAAESHAL